MALHRGGARMTRRFYVGPGMLARAELSMEGPIAHRLAKVLRLRAGESVVFFDGNGEDALVRLDDVSDRRVNATVLDRRAGPAESLTAVHLYQSITKGERFEWLVEKATEIGVARIVPLVAARAVVKTPAQGNRNDRWRRIAVEAAEQCGRSIVPLIEEPQTFEAALAGPGVVLLPYEDAEATAPNIASILHQEIDAVFAARAVSILIGPEGGYEATEVERAITAGAHVVTLGQRVLRSETAGLVSATLVMQACGELG
jgi:16S rRNA (uracil1498-N3)-methyltransferase